MTHERFFPDPARPLALLAACPAYCATPLQSLDLGDGRRVLAKYEGGRMNLGSFKALGGVYAIARLIGEAAQSRRGGTILPGDFQTPDVRAVASTMQFVCASAGNHGLSVAAGARIFGARSRVHLATTVSEGFAHRLQAAGAEVCRSGNTYEEAVDAARADAASGAAILVADGSWPGYTRIPSLIMEGYTVLGHELHQQLAASGEWPGRVFLQAGVGGMAAAIAHHIRHNWPVQPEIVVVEPEAAPCIGASLAAGKAVTVTGPASNMGRLDCKEPSLVALETLSRLSVTCLTIGDAAARRAADDLFARGLPTTPSGAAGFGALGTLPPRTNAPDLVIISEGIA